MPNNRSDGPLRLAFTDIVNAGWTAGAIYYKNLFSALRELDDDERPEIVVLMAPHQKTGGYDVYRGLANDVLELPAGSSSGFVGRQVRRVRRRLGADLTRGPLDRLLREHRVDALFACWDEFGPSFRTPVLGWIPDFQHKHYPQLFPPAENRYRDQLFGRMAANCTRIVLSSEDAQRDYREFTPAHADKARVLRFVAEVPPEVYEGDPTDVCEEYHLPERFVYLPNQFWVHKNHGVVIDALALLRDRPEVTVVCTGNPADNRDPLYFAELLARASRAGVRDRFVVLGWVPHTDTFRLLRQSVAVLQPSLFEGWSTIVEETKSIGKTIVVSDIPIHREQDAPEALYFDPTDAEALAERLVEVYDHCKPGPDTTMEQAARAELPRRVRDYGRAYLEIVRDVTARQT